MADTQTSNVVVNSRTISIKGDFDLAILGDYEELVTVTTSETGKTYIECKDIEDAQIIYDVFKENELNPRVVSYSLFFRSPDELTEAEAQTIFAGMTSANITYMRVDENGHTGKLVVDTLDDYKELKAFDGDDDSVGIKFYHFDPRTKHMKNKKNTKDDQPRTNRSMDEKPIRSRDEQSRRSRDEQPRNSRSRDEQPRTNRSRDEQPRNRESSRSKYTDKSTVAKKKFVR